MSLDRLMVSFTFRFTWYSVCVNNTLIVQVETQYTVLDILLIIHK